MSKCARAKGPTQVCSQMSCVCVCVLVCVCEKAATATSEAPIASLGSIKPEPSAGFQRESF